MKLFNILTATCAMAFAAVSVSEAQTAVRITGSTAFRAATQTAIENILNSGFSVVYYNGASELKAGQATFVGTLKSNNASVIIYTSWSGSVGGIQTLTQGLTVSTWLKASLATNPYTVIPGSASTPPTDDTESAKADISMSDTFQSSTLYTKPKLTAVKVGVVPFVWVKGNSDDTDVKASLSNVTNITSLSIQALLSYPVPMSIFTGTSTDSDYYIYPVGRDESSGTRLAALADSGYGAFQSPGQYEPLPNDGTDFTSIIPYPAQTILGTLYVEGHSGYGSGSGLAKVLHTPVASGATDGANKFALIGYLAYSDASSDVTGTTGTSAKAESRILTYNGVAYSPDNVASGKYSFWSYEQMVYGTLNATQLKTANDIVTNIKSTTASASGIPLSTMKVVRSVEGGVITY